MKVCELIEELSKHDPTSDVYISVREPLGWMCPDGATVELKKVCDGMDWHQGDIMLVPKHELDIHDVDEWSRG